MGAADPWRLPDGAADYAGLVGRLPAVVWETDAIHHSMSFVSPRARDILGHDPDTWCASPGFWAAHLHPDDRARVLGALERSLARGGGTVRMRYRFQDAAGAWRHVQDTVEVTVSPDGQHLAGLMQDLGDEEAELEAIVAGTVAGDAMAAQGARGGPLHQAIVDNLQDGVYYVDTERRIGYWNKGAERLSGHRAGAVIGRLCHDNILSHVDADGHNLCRDRCPLAATMRDGVERDLVVWLRHADGSRRPVHTRTAPIHDPRGAIVGGVEIFSDATGLVEAQDAAEAARRDALTDPLTGLPNRRLLDAVLASRRDDLERAGRPFALFILDVDHFKRFNDAYGHDTGDEALRVVATTLRGGVRGGDTLVRWGGEEFAIVAAVADAAAMARLAGRLLALMRSALVTTPAGPVHVRVSIGGALAEAGESNETLFVRADGALRAAKEAGRDRYVEADRAA